MRSLEDGMCYHIYNRGNNKAPIFFEDDNYIHFLKLFKKHLTPSCEIFAYCLMPNHYHLFLRTLDIEKFSKGIKNFSISYTKAINERYGRTGSLFQGRYKSTEIVDDSYFTRVITYIHQNPVKAGLVTSLLDYRYSSYPAYLSDKQSLLARQEVLSWFGGKEAFIDAHQINIDFNFHYD